MAEYPTQARFGRLAEYTPLIQAADGLTLSQVCTISALEPTTVQNWIKRGYVPHPVCKKYRERHLARILLIAELRESMQIERIGELLRYINGDTDDESDDIISEERLYDLFNDIVAELSALIPEPDEVEHAVRRHIGRCLSDQQQQQKVADAMSVMVYAHISAVFKQKADKVFTAMICGA